MAARIQKFFRKGFVKLSLVIITVLAIAVACLHIWFVHNANRLLIDLVNKRSQGKLKLELSRVNFNFFSNEVKIHKAKIASTAAGETKITYQVSFQKITLTTNPFWSAFFTNSLEIHKIKLYDPIVEVFSRPKDSTDDTKNDLSLGLELGKIYHSIEDAIITLNTHSISLINAKVILNNTSDKGKKPLVFSNIYFTLKKLNKPGSQRGKYVTNNNILFTSSNQDITFTDGIHQLLFKRLVIEKARNIILDSCTIIALPTPISQSSYNIHFKRLALIGVNFNALYKSNLIKADSVYCENPITDLSLSSKVTDSNSVNKGMPDPNKILREFAGDLDLGFLGVMDADIHLNITGKKRQSNIHSGKVNFQIKNLRISPDSSKQISLNAFDMLIKGYRLYNKDSSCIYSFDSIRFANDKLLLNNFAVHTTSGINKARSYRDFSMPSFELLGVDWPELIFEQNLKADEANLIDPTINYIRNTRVEISKKSLFLTSRRNFDDFMDIRSLNIVNGNLNIKWGENKSLQLQGFNLSVLGDNLSDYKHVRLQKDIESLFFQQGYLKAGDINARFRNITFKTNAPVHADQLIINNDQGGIDSKLDDVSIKNIYSEESTGNIIIDALQWANGSISVNPTFHSRARPKKTSLLLKNISGKNTQLNFTRNGITCDAFVTSLRMSSFQKINNAPVAINDMKLDGRKLNFSNASILVNSEKFSLSDGRQEFENTHFEKNGYYQTLVMDIPSIRLSNNIYSLFSDDLTFNNIVLISPRINFKKQSKLSVDTGTNVKTPNIKIEHISMREPEIDLQFGEDPLEKKISLPYSKGGELKADHIQVAPGGIAVGALYVKTQKAVVKGMEKDVSIDNGIDLNLSKINILKTGDSMTWSALLRKLSIKNSNGYLFNIKKNSLFLKDINIENCQLNPGAINNIGHLLSSNQNAFISTSHAKYTTPRSVWQCDNVSFDAELRLLKFDSVNYRPAMSRDSFIASNPYQVDYINFSSGRTELQGVDMVKYLNDNALDIRKVSLSRPTVAVYRDKFPPFLSGVRKGLFTEKIANIPFPVSINDIKIDDGKVSYTEKNEKNRLEGNLLLTHLSGNISNIKNNNSRPADSLLLSLTGTMLDQTIFSLKLNQSYSDSLEGFMIALKIEPTSFNFLNPLLAPLSNVKFTSGSIDKFEMNAMGNDNSAYGEMKFYYHNLHIQLLKNGGVEKTAFIKRRESDLVNFFFLRNNNTSRTGLVYFKRLKDRSFFNYINKIIFSGIVTSTGAKSNRRYRKEIKKLTW